MPDWEKLVRQRLPDLGVAVTQRKPTKRYAPKEFPRKTPLDSRSRRSPIGAISSAKSAQHGRRRTP